MRRKRLNNWTIYIEGNEIQDHIKTLRTQKAAVDNLSTTAMTDETWRGVIIRSIPPTTKWLPVIPSLYAMASSVDIISTLLAHGMILGRETTSRTITSTNSSSNTTALAARTSEGCANPNCKAKKRSTYTTSNCYWPGVGKEGQFPPNFSQRSKANVTTSTTTSTTATPTSGQNEHFVLSARVQGTPARSGVLIEAETNDVAIALITQGFQDFRKGKVPTFMDSGVSDTMFVSRDAFTEYEPTTPRTGDSAKAVDGSFEIIGEGNVIQRYRVNGKERKVTYTHALHTPALNTNLVSVGALDKAGLITTFGNGQGITRQADRTVVLSGKNVNGMYLLETVEPAPSTPLAMGSMIQPTTLEQWHRRLAHCNPLTIQEMANNGLVDGLKISDVILTGKCEDCIMGRQTRMPFDGETEKDLKPLDLVAFDLWGPSRVQSAGGKLYLMIIVDSGSSYKYGSFLADKSDLTVLEAFEAFRNTAETLTGRKLH